MSILNGILSGVKKSRPRVGSAEYKRRYCEFAKWAARPDYKGRTSPTLVAMAEKACKGQDSALGIPPEEKKLKSLRNACGRSPEGHHWVRGPRGTWASGARKHRTAANPRGEQIIHAQRICTKCGKTEIWAQSGKGYLVRR